jgi:hypothetical protein
MLKIIAIVVVVLIVGILAFAALQPPAFRVERSTNIRATPDQIVPLLDNFHNWSSWSPWEKLDPAMKRTYGGPDSGPGAVYGWEGNGKVGQGRMEVLETSPSKVAVKLDFLKPFEAHNTAEFVLQPQGETTDVTWAMYGDNNFLSKVMCVFVSMDKMVGKDFENGLANLKSIAEK